MLDLILKNYEQECILDQMNNDYHALSRILIPNNIITNTNKYKL